MSINHEYRIKDLEKAARDSAAQVEGIGTKLAALQAHVKTQDERLLAAEADMARLRAELSRAAPPSPPPAKVSGKVRPPPEPQPA